MNTTRALLSALSLATLIACGGAEPMVTPPAVDPAIGVWQKDGKDDLRLTLAAGGTGAMTLNLGASTDAALAGCTSTTSVALTWKAAPYRVALPMDSRLLVLRSGCADPSKNVAPAAELAMDDPDRVGFGIVAGAVIGAFTEDKTTIAVNGDQMKVDYELAGNTGIFLLLRASR